MTKTNAQLLLVSRNQVTGDDLYTWVLTFPRVILAEVNTHRVASRNTSSSRAIPAKKMRRNVLTDPFIPAHIGAARKGMQAGAEISGWRRKAVELLWRAGAYSSAGLHYALEKLGAPKQVMNRVLEPYSWCQQVFTATDVKNIFKLRTDAAAEPHFQELARQMKEQVEAAKRTFRSMESQDKWTCTWVTNNKWGGTVQQILRPGEWHLPFIDMQDWSEAEQDARECFYEEDLPYHMRGFVVATLKAVSVARCARTSYSLLDTGKRSTREADIALFNKLAGSGHWSPFEHVAEPTPFHVRVGNFKGWRQYRKEFKDEAGGDN